MTAAENGPEELSGSVIAGSEGVAEGMELAAGGMMEKKAEALELDRMGAAMEVDVATDAITDKADETSESGGEAMDVAPPSEEPQADACCPADLADLAQGGTTESPSVEAEPVDPVSVARQLLEEALQGGQAEKVGKAYVAWVRLTTAPTPTGTQDDAGESKGQAGEDKGKATQKKGKAAANGAPGAPAQAGKPAKRGRGRPKKAPVAETAPETAAVESETPTEAETTAEVVEAVAPVPPSEEGQVAEGATAMEGVISPENSVANATNANATDAAAVNANGGPQDDPEAAALRGRVMDVVQAWRETLALKSQLDAQSHKDNGWYAGSVKQVTPNEDGSVSFLVRFSGFSEKHNEWFHSKDHAARLMPMRSYTGKLRALSTLTKDPEKAEAERLKLEKRQQRLELEAKQQQEAARQAEANQVVETNRYGRAVKRVLPKTEGASATSEGGEASARKSLGKRKRKSEAPEGGEGEEGDDDAGMRDTGGKDSNDWICGACDQLDREDDKDRLVLCDGPCKRSFHQSCLGMSTATLQALDTWLCEQCKEREHTCFVCGDSGKDDMVGGVHKCMRPNCGKFYHQHCVDQCRAALIMKRQDEVPAGTGEGGGEVDEQLQPYKFNFICARHSCDVCGRGKENGFRSKLFTCLRCPRAYHANCLPPGAKFHEYLCLCSEHAHMGLPPLPGDEECYNNDVSDSADGWMSLVLKSLELPRGPPSRSTDVAHFRLKQRFFNEVYSKPPPFTHIPGLRYICKVAPTEPGSECQCEGPCGPTCLNRILHIECVGGCKEDAKADKYSNCRVGPECSNRAFKNKEYIKHQVFRENNRGWGLRTMEDVKKGQLVFEYVGEVIDDDELERRLAEHAVNHPNDPNMYIMELESGLYLDARHKGNSSRFINHSCDPNCELQKWNVRGFTRIGIMALRDIPAYTPLSYDYQFATSDENKFKCHCGSDNCRGSLAPRNRSVEKEIEALLQAQEQGGGKLSKADRRKLIDLHRKREKREQAKVSQMARASQSKHALTSRSLPGDPTAEIKAGPPKKYERLAQYARLFMVRNTRVGADFIRRRDLMFKAAAARRALPPSSSSSSSVA